MEITPLNLQVEVGGILEVAGGGFALNEIVLFKLIIDGDTSFILEGGFANDAGAFLATNVLPAWVTPGLYTVQALVRRGTVVASTPLIVTEAK